MLLFHQFCYYFLCTKDPFGWQRLVIETYSDRFLLIIMKLFWLFSTAHFMFSSTPLLDSGKSTYHMWSLLVSFVAYLVLLFFFVLWRQHMWKKVDWTKKSTKTRMRTWAQRAIMLLIALELLVAMIVLTIVFLYAQFPYLIVGGFCVFPYEKKTHRAPLLCGRLVSWIPDLPTLTFRLPRLLTSLARVIIVGGWVWEYHRCQLRFSSSANVDTCQPLSKLMVHLRTAEMGEKVDKLPKDYFFQQSTLHSDVQAANAKSAARDVLLVTDISLDSGAPSSADGFGTKMSTSMNQDGGYSSVNITGMQTPVPLRPNRAYPLEKCVA